MSAKELTPMLETYMDLAVERYQEIECPISETIFRNRSVPFEKGSNSFGPEKGALSLPTGCHQYLLLVHRIRFDRVILLADGP